MGAGGRDFHVFNTCYREDDLFEVVAFTAAQIPHIEDRIYPPVLAGANYPNGIPIRPETELDEIIGKRDVAEVIFAYSDVSYEYLDSVSQRVAASGAEFRAFDVEAGLLDTSKPCVAICAVRTGCGKSPLSRYVAQQATEMGLAPAIVRHPMPYGNLGEEIVQRFESVADLACHHCTIEEMEEYEPHLLMGNVVYAGADYAKILAAAEGECDLIIWDGGNNDTPFVKPDLLITLLDPLRAGDELNYFPGKWNFEQADVLVIGKIDRADEVGLERLRENIRRHNSGAEVIEGRLPISLDDPGVVKGKRVLVVEDGPTITHGGMAFGAGYLAAQEAGAAEIVDPRPFASGEISEAYHKFPHVQQVLPALGYSQKQLTDLESTIRNVNCDAVIVATPIDLARIVRIERPTIRVSYSFEERNGTRLVDILREKLRPDIT